MGNKTHEPTKLQPTALEPLSVDKMLELLDATCERNRDISSTMLDCSVKQQSGGAEDSSQLMVHPTKLPFRFVHKISCK